MARGAAGTGAETLPEIVVYVPGPDGEPVELAPPTTTADALRDLTSRVGHRLEHVRELHAATGQRLGPTTDRPDRRGASEEVLVSLLIDPALAAEAVLDGRLFQDPLGRLDVVTGSICVDDRGLSWSAGVRTGWFTRRAATLRLYPSPSANVTVLELIPDRPRLLRTRAFVRVGVDAMRELALRLTLGVARAATPVATA